MSAWFLYNVPSAFKEVDRLNAQLKAKNWQADDATKVKVHDAYLKKQAVLKEAFMRLVKATYGITDQENMTAIERKMDFCAFLFSGSHPAKNSVDPGFMCNTVQAVGMGAQIFNQYDTDMNLHNIHKVEEHIYKMPVPRWTKFFPEKTVDQALADKGKPLYDKECGYCHTIERNAGPTKTLYNYNLYAEDELKTDMTFAREIVTPVVTKREKNATGIMVPTETVPFKVAGRGLFQNVVKRYYERWGVDQATQDIWESKE